MKSIFPWRMLAAASLVLAAAVFQPAHAGPEEDAVNLVLPFTQLRGSAEGLDALDNNLSTAITIQNTATEAQRLQAIKDYTIDSQRATSIADGMGDLFQGAYFSAIFAGNSALLPQGSIYVLFKDVGSVTGKMVDKVKSTFGLGPVPDGGEHDVYGRTYLPGATLADRDELAGELNDQLNPRPFQVAPYNSDTIVEFSGRRFIAPLPGGAVTVGERTTNTQLNEEVADGASFLSGHTTYAYSSAIAFAMMVPEKYQELMLRASEFGNSRLVMGAHYPIDVIGGRTLATYALAHWLADPNNRDKLETASADLRTILTTNTGSRTFEDALAAEGTWSAAELDAARATYAYRMTYGLPNVGTTSDDPPDVAHYLLLTRFPYLNAAQRQEVIRTTMLADAGPLANDMAGYEAWTRINLFDAAGGYGSLDADTTIHMDAASGGLNAYDTWNNDIGGIGFLTKQGTGSLELSGTSTFAGVDVLDGTILLSGPATFTDTSTVGGDGQRAALLLGPSLTVPSLVIFADGMLGRVGDYGATQLNGDVSFASGSGLMIRFGGEQTATDNFQISGTTQIASDATFQMINPDGNVPTLTGEYTVLTSSGGLTGQFDDVLLPNTFATTFALMSDANRIYVTVTTNPIAGAADTPNQRAIANYVDAVINAGVSPGTEALTNGIRNLVTRAEVQAALDQISPQVLADAQLSTLYASLGFANALLSCKINAPGTASIIREGQCLWAGASATFLNRGSTVDQPGYSATTGSFAAGAQVALDDAWRLGFGAGYQTDSIATPTNAHSSGSLGQAGVALKYNVGSLLLAGVVSGGGGTYDTERTQAFGGFSAAAESSTTIGVLNGGLRIAYVMGSPQLYLKPVLDAGVTHISLGGTNETGSGGLAVSGGTQDVYTVAPSLELGTEWWLTNGTLVRPFLRGGATIYEGGDMALSAAFIGAPPGIAPFTIVSKMDDVMGDIGAGIDLITSGDSVLHAAYDGQFGETTQIHSVGVKGSVRY